MTVTEYDKIKCLSASKLKMFATNVWKFKKWWVDNVEPKQKKSSAITLGNIVDFRLLRDKESGTGEENFDDLFTLYIGKNVTGQVLKLAEELYNVTLDAQDDLGQVDATVEELMETAIGNCCFDDNSDQIMFKGKSTEKIIKYFYDKGGFDFYRTLRENTGRTVVNLKELDIANKLIGNIKNHWVTRDIFLAKHSRDREVLNQFAYVFDLEGTKFKILVDKVIVNHIKKKIVPFDLKTTFDQSQFERNFIDLGYYFQLAAYTYGMVKWALEKGYDSYVVEPLTFVVCPTTFTQDPFQAKSTWNDYAKAMNGFVYHGRKIKGLRQTIEEINWHHEKGIWGMSKELFENKGIKTLDFI